MLRAPDIWSFQTLATELTIQTNGQGLYEFTGQLSSLAMGDGVLNLFVRHTSCSLLIQENADSDVQTDLAAFFERFVPPADTPEMAYLKHTYEGPDDMPAHIKASVLPVSLTIPVVDGQLGLGTWQGVYLFEHRRRPHQRQVLASMLAAL